MAEDRELRREIRELRRAGNELAESVRDSWDALGEERMAEIVKQLSVIAQNIEERERKTWLG